MPRSKDLSSHNIIRHEPLKHKTSRVNGPVSFLNPTTAHVHDENTKPDSQKAHVAYKWSSRNNRKGRHELAISPTLNASATPTPASTAWNPRHILKIFWLMIVYYPVWDISWDVAWIFTWGSIIWVLNAFFVFLPLIAPSTTFPNESLYAGGITAFIGATVFEVGSVLLMIEAVNENRADCFGWEVKQALQGKPENGDVEKEAGAQGISVVPKQCTHHHANKHNFVGKGPQSASAGVKASNSGSSRSSEETAAEGKDKGTASMSKAEQEMADKRRAWIWFPTKRELTGHYLHELGFLASSFQMVGATIFWIAGFTALPGIQNKMSLGLLDGVYWTPQVVGGLGFVISGTLFMVETQRKWYIPAFGVLGWHIGFWNLIGGIGFTLSPIFGYYPTSWGLYQACCSTFWGSWAFLIGSTIQLYESLDKRPVSVEEVGGGE